MIRLALRLDALASGGVGLALLLAAPVLDGPLGLSAGTQRVLGLFLALWAPLLLALAGRPSIRPGPVWAVLVVNVLWVLETVVALVAGVFPLTGLGVAFMIVQAVTVLVLVELQWIGLRRLQQV
ncbi:hypothetical protein Val02_31790 [Virgisporangium aliadipatigenens]|uniref:Integral membrane protein n=1 Tax=Virgisporangium aliadipatigenens TaxID=741659 RepID=A0A8J3YLG3_9ACTN|nr:hypothetical protein Val02_31790 [Virgisporangium aliadipatigenens]